MGMTGGSFNTREFFHGKPLWLVQRVKHAFLLLAFALPAALLLRMQQDLRERWGVAAPDFGFLLALQACPKARLARFLQSNTLGMAG